MIIYLGVFPRHVSKWNDDFAKWNLWKNASKSANCSANGLIINKSNNKFWLHYYQQVLIINFFGLIIKLIFYLHYE